MAKILRVSAILLIVLHLRCTVQRCGAQSQQNDTSLYLLVLLPYPSSQGNPSWSGALNVLPAIRLAVKDIQSSDILIGYNLSVIERDCGCNYTNRARISFLDSVFYKEKQIVGLVGPGCSASAVAIAPLIAQEDASLLSIHGAGTPQLENHTKYPNLFGIFGSSLGIVNTIIALMRDREWTNVGVLYDSSRVFQSSTHDALIDLVMRDLNTTKIHSAALADHHFHLDQVREKSLRIVFLLAGPALARNLLCTAFHRNMTYPLIQWVIVERLLIELDQSVAVHYEKKNYSCSRDVMTNQVLNGSLFITYRLANFDENAVTYANVSYKQFISMYNSEIERMNTASTNTRYNHFKISPWGSMFYDAVWAMALALDMLQQSHRVDLKEYGSSNGTRRVNDTLELRGMMHKLNFEGVSGKVKFNATTGFIERAFDISAVFNNTMNLIAFCDDGSNISHLVNGSGELYYLEDEFPQITNKTPLPVAIVIGVFTLIVFCVTVLFHTLALRYRNDYFVRAASRKLSQIAYAGCYLLLLTSSTYFIEQVSDLQDNIRTALCHFTYIFCSIGFTLLFGAILAKEWRLYRISNHFWKPAAGKCLSDRPLSAIILLAASVDILINIVWISFDRFKVESNQIGFSETEEIITKHCHADFLLVWYLTIYTYNLLILLLACVLALITHKIYIVGIQTKAVLRMAYLTFLLMGLGIPIQITFVTGVHLEQTVIFVVDSTLLNVAVVLAIIFLFFPPLRPRFYKLICKRLPGRNVLSTSITIKKQILCT